MIAVVFLDVDGVLNSEAFNRTLEEQHRQLGHHEVCECFKLYRQIDRQAVTRLNRLVAETRAKIVISSSWRLLFDPPELSRILVEHGLVAEIIGETPDGPNDPEMLAAYGHIDRVFRGHEIDFWLKKHPEVTCYVILDDCSDMEMHKHRLVQTDCEEGLLDEHVELAIRVMSWDGKSLVEGQVQGTLPAPMDGPVKLPSREPLIVQVPTLLSLVNDQLPSRSLPMDAMESAPAIVSTRSNANEDARRDFDGFSPDEELSRFRLALRDGQWRIAAELAANLDEHLCRGGSLPVAWLGPVCMQEQGDLTARLRSSLKAAEKMSPKERREVLGGYVAVSPAPAPQPRSGAGLHCHHCNDLLRRDGCVEALLLERTTTVRPSEEDDCYEILPTLDEAAVFLGWRIYQSVWWCPTHVVAKNLACAWCLSACPTCSCMGGPFAKAVEGIDVSCEEKP